MPAPELAGVAIEAFIDHACPHSALQAAALAAVGDAISVRWRVLPLAGRVSDLPPAERRMHAARFVADWPRVASIGSADFGWTMLRPEWPIDSRPAAAAALHVRHTHPAAEGAVHAALFKARFTEGQDITLPSVIASIVGLAAGDECLRGLGDALSPSAVEMALAPDQAEAERLALRGVPALLIGDRLLVGAQRAAVIRGIIAQSRLGAPA